ncbi:MAG TPA: hypothetical protein VFP87_09300 [Chitinophagaceae bacterium]|nr:hypothetical protein [Chitinophagaceae bacterium]
MKKILLLSVVCVLGSNLFSQPAVKIFAYQQDNLPGTRPAGVLDENGKPIKKAAPKKNYFIYLSFNKKYRITPVEIFIKGKSFVVERAIESMAPVEYTDNTVPNNPEKTTLVPATNNKVIQVPIAEPSLQQKKASYVQKLASRNDVVIAYVWNKKRYFAVVNRIKNLAPRANE